MSTVKKRKSLTIEQKCNIISSLESGCSNTFISQQYNLSHSTVSNIFKQRAEIKRTFEQASFATKKIRYSMNRDIENALLEWLKRHRGTNVSVNIPSLQAKADEFGNLLGKPNFKCSSSWVQRFKRRHHSEFVNVNNNDDRGKTQVVVRPRGTPPEVSQTLPLDGTPRGAIDRWLENEWPSLRKGYSDKEIYSASETGVFYKLMPDQSFRYQGHKCTDGELSKERLTILVTANMTGTKKKKLLVIGKPKDPQSCKGIKDLPIQYEHNQKSWMTSLIFKHFLQQWDMDLFQTFQKALLLIDDCPVHSGHNKLRSIKVVYFPYKSSIQPMNQGIIKSLKFHFKKKLILHHAKQIENISIAKVDIFQAICMLESAWEQISPQMITNCFGSAKLKEVEEKSSKEESLVSWAANLLVYDSEALQQFENVDSELITSSQLLGAEHINHGNNGEETDNDEEVDTRNEKITLSQVFDALDKLKQYLATNEHFPKSYDHTKQLQILLENKLYKQLNSQTKITNYFKKLI
ncbi:tigger transposable element-derived protein 4-like isoform X2 [Myzus persicae]|uniref:tigger transposable element-derived protein 4-like isoform X2 n=1 Tax=Myzus persicae TaxID=13164 RepID=UPI000B935203|nr:tigger transposable element-derived protein 4-like isoform X2 [Myzus persicae]